MTRPDLTLFPEPNAFADLVADSRAKHVNDTRPLLIPVYAEFLADMETPVSLFERVRHRPDAFLLESVAGGEQVARYTFFGSDPRLVFRAQGGEITLSEVGNSWKVALAEGEDPLHILEELLREDNYVASPNLPRFVGGAVGYIGYDWVRFLEPIGETAPDELGLPDVHLLLTDVLCIFDHVRHTLKIVANAEIAESDDPVLAYAEARRRILAYSELLHAPRPQFPPHRPDSDAKPEETQFVSNMTRDSYTAMIERAREYIAAGDIIQVVLSQRFSRPLHADSFSVYRSLRSLNPSPYMFYLAFEGGITLVGASPEILVTDNAGQITVRPIAGTRRRGATDDEDRRLEAELLADEKERAEHIMLVDLGRNDIGRVCEYGSVRVDSLMHVERYSHVMHIVSNVTGRRRGDKSPFDVLRATFPAGTLSGAPKVRAMQIIEELEPSRRGVYGGAIGYFSLNGTFDACITIRTLLVKDGIAYIQAGGGIVADSKPDDEFDETVNKSGAVRRAIELAESGYLHSATLGGTVYAAASEPTLTQYTAERTGSVANFLGA